MMAGIFRERRALGRVFVLCDIGAAVLERGGERMVTGAEEVLAPTLITHGGDLTCFFFFFLHLFTWVKPLLLSFTPSSSPSLSYPDSELLLVGFGRAI